MGSSRSCTSAMAFPTPLCKVVHLTTDALVKDRFAIATTSTKPLVSREITSGKDDTTRFSRRRSRILEALAELFLCKLARAFDFIPTDSLFRS
jgi:hypothetical protein